MKAVVLHKAFDLRLDDRLEIAPRSGEVQIAIKCGGICTSDLRYYRHGGAGNVRLREPLVLGHEVSGEVIALGDNITTLKIGDRVAVNPSQHCDICAFCQKGWQHLCLNMAFLASAARVPHIQGAFQQAITVRHKQCYKIADHITWEEATFTESLAVAIHAVGRANNLINKRVLVAGCGPIGTLVIIAARYHGAREIVATDVSDFPLEIARQVGADQTINVSSQDEDMLPYKFNKGGFDIMFEASGYPPATRLGLEVLKPRGILVQIGLGGEVPMSQNLIAAKEIEIRGAYRFYGEFDLALDLINRRCIDVKPLLTTTMPLQDVIKAFQLAANRSRSMKVQLAF